MLVWFVAIAVGGLSGTSRRTRPCCSPSIPVTASGSCIHHGIIGLFTLGAVFLAVTGAEALYADLGHFGRRPIQAAWLGLVLPALAINYLGPGRAGACQSEGDREPVLPALSRLGAAADGAAGDRRDRDRQPGGDHRRLFADRQAIQLGLLPRLEIRHTSARSSGRSTCRGSTRCCWSACCCWSALFRSSSALASAYGIAVTGTMVVTGHDGLHRDLAGLALVAVCRGGADRAVPVHRSHLPVRQSCSRWWRAAGCRWRSAAW